MKILTNNNNHNDDDDEDDAGKHKIERKIYLGLLTRNERK